MVVSNVKDLYENLESLLLEMGINPAFKDNPAYEDVINHINGFIRSMNISTEVSAKKEELKINEGVFQPNIQGSIDGSRISFTYTGADDTYTMNIFTSKEKPDNISIYYTDERKSEKAKTCIHSVVKLSNNAIGITDYQSTIFGSDKNVGYCENDISYKKIMYNSDGLNYLVEDKSFGLNRLSESFESAKTDSMLYIPHFSSEPGDFMHDSYKTRYFMRRGYLDTAKLIYENRENNTYYSGVVPLNQEHGLRNMRTMGGHLQGEINIPKLSSDAISAMIEKENNPKVKEGLKKFAVGRESYSYSSSNDREFKCNMDGTTNKVI